MWHARVLGGAEDGEGLAVEDGKLGLLVGGDEEPGGAGGPGAGVPVAEAVEKVEPVVADEEPGPGEEEGAGGFLHLAEELAFEAERRDAEAAEGGERLSDTPLRPYGLLSIPPSARRSDLPPETWTAEI